MGLPIIPGTVFHEYKKDRWLSLPVAKNGSESMWLYFSENDLRESIER